MLDNIVNLIYNINIKGGKLNYADLESRLKMTTGIRVMNDLGFIDYTDKCGDNVMRAFKKYDDMGFITDTINYFYSKVTGVEVFTNNLKYECGSALDKDLLNAIIVNFIELQNEKELEK